MKSISVIIPLYNEQESLPDLYLALQRALASVPQEWELLFVDDGSTDDSFRVLQDVCSSDSRVKLIRLRRNFGKSAALSAGFRLAEGDVIVTIDADLQDDPAEIPRLVAKLEEGYDLVSGWKKERQDPISKRWPSKVFNHVTALLTGVPLHDINCGLKAYRRQVLVEIRVHGEMHRYIPVLASYRGFVVGEIPVRHRRRIFGRSKFGPARFLGGFFDLLTVIMLTRYSSKPLHIFGILGALSTGTGLVILSLLSIGWFLGEPIRDRPLFMLGILTLLAGIQLTFFGLLAEMIAYSSKREDDFSIREVVSFEQEAPQRMTSLSK